MSNIAKTHAADLYLPPHVKNPLRKIQRMSDWLDDRKANRDDRKLREKYAPLVKEAEKKKDSDGRYQMLSEWNFESDMVLDPGRARKVERLTAKARKYGISVPHKPSSYSEESKDWYLSDVHGFWLLRRETEQRLRREIRDEQRTNYDEYRKWATLGFAFLAFVLGLVSLLVKQKQPDPCPQNYYRSNSGECVFALQKSTVQPQPRSVPAEARPANVPPPPAYKPSRR